MGCPHVHMCISQKVNHKGDSTDMVHKTWNTGQAARGVGEGDTAKPKSAQTAFPQPGAWTHTLHVVHDFLQPVTCVLHQALPVLHTFMW